MRAAVPHGHYKTITLVAGIRLSGLIATKVFDRPINAALFEDWVEQCLVPALSQGDIVVVPSREWLEFGWRSLRVAEPK